VATLILQRWQEKQKQKPVPREAKSFAAGAPKI